MSTAIRDGNYDFLTNSQKWHNTTAGFAMPESLYLRSKPSFFGKNPWPCVNPTNGSLAELTRHFGLGTDLKPGVSQRDAIGISKARKAA
jgi:hypothetical protein